MAFGKSWTMNTKASLKEYKRQRQVAKSIKWVSHLLVLCGLIRQFYGKASLHIGRLG